MINTFFLSFICTLIGILPLSASDYSSDTKLYEKIKSLARGHEASALKQAKFFLKTYPRSAYVPDVRLILADLETSPEEALSKYSSLVDAFPAYPRRDYAQYRLCQIHYLLSHWTNLKTESKKGIRLFEKSTHADAFRFFLVTAYIHLEDYDEAERECRVRIDNNHCYENLAESLLILSYIHKMTKGFSREYITSIKEIAAGYEGSDIYPAALFFLGEFYEQKKKYDESFSAFSDILSRFPGSPESMEAGKRLKALDKFNPRRVFYLPGKKIIEDTNDIDISPEVDIPENEDAPIFYSITVGPFSSHKRVMDIKKLLDEFNYIKTVRLKEGYALHVGRSSDEDSILKIKIRLAEEYGLNGRIVRISGDGRNSYIYGE